MNNCAQIAEMHPLLVDTLGAARALSVSERTVWSLMKRGDLPAIRIGRALRFAAEDLREWVDRRRADGGKECG
jgi:excisionase family DNA binding protein